MTYGVEYWGPALISALGSAYTARSVNQQNMQANAFNQQQAWEMYHGTNEYNAWARHETEAYNAQQAALAREDSAQQAGVNRDFQERMRSTQYQTAVKDMQAAGLNPMLAYSQGGAGTPGGAQGQVVTASSPGMSGASGQVPSRIPMQKPDFSSMLNAAQSVVAFEQNKANVELTRAQAEETASRVPANMMRTRQMEAEVQDLVDRKPEIQARIDSMKAGTFKDEVQAEVNAAMQALIRAQEETEKGKPAFMQTQNALHRAQTTLIKYGFAEAEAGSEAWSRVGEVGKEAGMAGSVMRGLAALKGLWR